MEPAENQRICAMKSGKFTGIAHMDVRDKFVCQLNYIVDKRTWLNLQGMAKR